MEAIKVVLTALLSIAALFIITKLMGHKQVAQMDFFDYVSGITVGSIGAELATEPESPVKPLIALAVWGAVSILLALATNKLPRTRKFINGTPTILMDNGKIYRKNLKKAKLDLSEFLLLCREQGYFDLCEIQTAVLETNGKLSVLPRAADRPITPSDLKITVTAKHMGTEVIMDGRIMGENLSRMGKDAAWLEGQLRLQGYQSPREVFLGIWHAESATLSLFPMQ